MKILGVDPGSVSGAYAFYDTIQQNCIVGDLPITDDGVNSAEFFRLVADLGVDLAIVERVGAMPGQGLSSTFKFGKSYGAIVAVLACAGVEVHLVTPAKWKAHFRLAGGDKEAARTHAIRLFPNVAGLERRRDHGRAEALLLTRWFVEANGRGGRT